jgi:uncharacterized protein DUF6603
MSDVFSVLGVALARLYGTLVESLTSDDERTAMLTELGLPVPQGPAPDVTAARQAIDQLHAKAQADPQHTAEQVELLTLLVASSTAVRALFEDISAGSDRTAETLCASYLELMCLITMRLQHPAGYAVLQALRFLDDREIYFERLGDLLSEGGDILRGGQPISDEEMDTDAATIVLGALAFAGFFIPEPLDQSFTRKILFGVDLDPATAHPNAQRILNRAVTFDFEWHTPEGTEGTESGRKLLVTSVLVPPHHGGPGLFLSLGGEGEVVFPLAGKKLELKITVKLAGGLAGYLGSGPVQSFAEIAGVGGAPSPDLGVKVALQRPLEAVQSEDPARLLGGADSFHFEVRSFRLIGQLGTEDIGIQLTLEKAALVVPKDSMGSFLGSIMPSDGLRLEATVTLGISRKRRFYIEGGAGLKATLPLEKSIPGVKLHTVTVEIAAKKEQPDQPAAVDIMLYAAFTIQAGTYFQASFDRAGLSYGTRLPKDKSGPVLGTEMKLDKLLPTGIGVSIDVWGFQGGGFLLFDQDRNEYGGVLDIGCGRLRAFAFKAFGLLTERAPRQWSFILVLSLEFDPGLQFGFLTLHGVGGIVAINHTIDVTALQAGLRAGVLDKILFPADPVADAPAILQTLRTVFPPSDHRLLVGPMFKLGIGDFLTASVALVVVAPSPYLVALLGSLRLAVPAPDHAVVDLRADFFGVYDLSTGAVSIDASLVKSRIASYPLVGDLAYRSGHDWFFSIGGFHPHFPVPASAPPLRRLCFDMSASARVKLRIEIYFAMTSNTIQFGFRGELTVEVGSFGVYGLLAVDGLLSHGKLSLHVSLTLELRFHGSVLAALQADLLVEGLDPRHVKGRVSMSILFWDISVPFDETWGEFQAEVRAADIDVLATVRESVTEQGAWAPVLPGATESLVTFRSAQRDAVVVHPLGGLTIQQGIVPLGVTVTRVGTAQPAGGPTAAYLGPVTLTGGISPGQAPVTGQFARAQYFDLTDDEKLSAPSYEPFQVGIELAAETVHPGLARRTDVAYETILVGAEDVPHPPSGLDLSHLSWAVGSGAVARSGLHDSQVNAGPDQLVRIGPRVSVVVDTATMQPATDVLASPASRTIAEQALASVAAANPARGSGLQVVGAHEVAR